MIDFLKYRALCLGFSVVLLFTGFTAYFYRGGFAYSIDFTGGCEIRLAFEKPLEIAALRKLFTAEQFGEAVVQSIEGGQEYLIKISKYDSNIEEIIKKIVESSFVDNTVTIKAVEKIGPEAGSEVRYNAIMSIFLALITMGLYIMLRQKYAYAIGATAALAHDILVILTYCLVFQEPISLIVLAAILSILGYSINDTIIVFSRINDNLGLSKKMNGFEVVNHSINQTLSRTILTSFSTLLSMLAVYFFGGAALKSFATVMIIGIIFGTYSSIYIASPIMLYFNDQFQN